MRGSGALWLRLGVVEGNLRAERFWENSGYVDIDRKSTRLNSSHLGISYAVFCLKKKKDCSIVLALLSAWAQSDIKRMVAYLSINHLSYCMLGLFAVTARSPSSIDTHAAFSGVFM